MDKEWLKRNKDAPGEAPRWPTDPADVDRTVPDEKSNRAAANLDESADDDDFWACGDCGASGYGSHACAGRPGENEF